MKGSIASTVVRFDVSSSILDKILDQGPIISGYSPEEFGICFILRLLGLE